MTITTGLEQDWALDLIRARRTVLPRRLVAPGPDDRQRVALFEAAACAPDHDQCLPWRLIVVSDGSRQALGEAFAQALHARDPAASAEQMAQAREKALRAPLLMAAVVDADAGGCVVPLAERLLSLGAAVQNLLLAATAMGYGSALTSGKAMNAAPVRAVLQLSPAQEAVCFISVGTVSQAPPAKQRPSPDQFVRQV